MKKFAKAYPKTHKALKIAGTVASTAIKAYQIASKVAALVNTEKKYYDVAISKSGDTAAQVICLTGMAQGDTESTRVGDSIMPKSLQAKLKLMFDTTNPSENVRVVIVKDKDNNVGTPPGYTQVYQMTAPYTLRSMDYPKRFKVLYDKIFTCNTTKPVVNIDWYYKYKMMKDFKGNYTRGDHITFTGQLDTDTARSHVYLMLISSHADGASALSLSGYTRLRYIDN